MQKYGKNGSKFDLFTILTHLYEFIMKKKFSGFFSNIMYKNCQKKKFLHKSLSCTFME